MKKGLLSILAGALLVVGCQNYDDQFTDLENQITALTSTVAGLAQVQSDLQSLSATVSSLQSSLAGQIDTALVNGLNSIDEAIKELELATADVLTAEDVDGIQDLVTANQEDLQTLLSQSSVFTGPVTINSQTTLNAFHAMGDQLAIVNGSVTFDVKDGMDLDKVQDVANVMLTIVNDLKYEIESNTIKAVTFNKLTGVASLTVKTAGSISFPELVSATNVVLNDAFENKILSVSFPKLESVTKFTTGTVANEVVFTSATSIDLSALKRYPESSLTLETDEGGTLNIAALDDVNAQGTQKDLTLSVKGPASFTSSLITDGTSMTFEDVVTVSVTDFRGDIIIKDGVEDLTIVNGVEVSFDNANALTTADIAMVLDNDPILTTENTAALPYGSKGDLTFASMGDLTTLTISGETGAISITDCSNIETLNISSKSDDLTIDDNDDLITVNVEKASFANVTVTGNGDLETLTLNHTTILTKSAKTAPTAVTATISHNPKLETLTFGADKVKSLTVSNNAKLETIDFSGLSTIGGSGDKATVLIKENKLAASEYRDTHDADKDGTGKKGDTGSYTSDSGLATLQTYLDAAVAAPTTDGVVVYFDIIDTAVEVSSDGTETSSIPGLNGIAQVADYAASAGKFAVVNTKAQELSDIDTVKQASTMVIDINRNSLIGEPSIATTDGVNISFAGVDLKLKGTSAITTISQLVAELDGNTAFGSEATVTADRSVYSKTYYKINYTNNGSNANIAEAGNLYYNFSDDASGTFALGASDTADEIAHQLASSTVLGADTDFNFDGDTISGTIIVYATVSGTNNSNLGPGAKARPALTFNTATSTTSIKLTGGLSGTDTEVNAQALSTTGTVVLSAAKTDVSGIRVTVTNNNASVSRTATMGLLTGTTALEGTSTLVTGASGNMTTPTIDTSVGILTADQSNGYAAYDAQYSDVQAPAEVTAESLTDRTSWLTN